jgi:Rrf2 family cysteine metabolism transcriptional repressor
MLRISTKGRYATRIVVYLACMENSGRPARKHEIAEAEEISPDYVEQILIKLKAAGLVTSRRGAKGGFSLARRADEITVTDVLDATEGPLSLVPCLSETCHRATSCVTRSVWREAGEALDKVFSARTIAEMAEEAKNIQASMSPTFEI